MMRKALMLVAAVMLSGCSAASVLSGLTSDAPQVTAQAGAENVKQTIGVTAKQDASSKQETSVKDSTVKRLDSSNKKKVAASTIQADTITAEKIEVVNGGESPDTLFHLIALACMFFAGFFTRCLFTKSKKEP